MKKERGFALGNFDGVHLGHQIILKNLIRRSKARGLAPCVYTFDPHPAKLLAPHNAPRLLQTLEQKLEALKNFKISEVVVEPFTQAFSHKTPRQFVEAVLVKRLHAKLVCVGYDFTFGFKRSGTAEVLKKLLEEKKIPLIIIAPQFRQKVLVSSTQIRSLVAQGKVDRAAAFLGRPFALIGKVVKGKGYGGSKLHIHTANMKVENELLPKTGIYATRTRILRTTNDERRTTHWYPSATSVGFNPTFPGKGFSVETHLIGFRGELRGKKIEVAFLKWLRDELAFPNPETLAEQIHKDIAEAKKINETLRDHR